MFKQILITTVLVLGLVKAGKDQCHCMALEGGGDKGAYQAGVVRALVDGLPIDEVGWQVLSGVSVGALNAGGLTKFAIGDENAMADYLIEMWRGISASQVYKNWLGGIV
jgi:predicted acylesterase/phospholipase RssA